jgi:hypothetical protein
MKKYIAVLTTAFSLIVFLAGAQTTTDTIKVWGNCGSCKEHIETAALSAGATTADWNKTSKLLVVSYNATKTSNTKIQEKIAGAGYDTQDKKAKEADYKKLDKCCQYDRPAAKGNSAANNNNTMKCCGDADKCAKMDNCCKKDTVMACCNDMKDATAKQSCCNGKDCGKM